MNKSRAGRRENATKQARQAIAAGALQDRVLQLLRDEGLNKIDSMLALHDLYEMPLDEAKATVHVSKVWQDRRSTDERLHVSLEQAIQAADEPQRMAG